MAIIPDDKIDRAKLPDIPRFQVLSGRNYLIIMVRYLIDKTAVYKIVAICYCIRETNCCGHLLKST